MISSSFVTGKLSRRSLGSSTAESTTSAISETQFQYLWSKIARKSSIQSVESQDISIDDEKRQSLGTRCCQLVSKYLHLHALSYKLNIAFQHAYIVVSMSLTFCILTAIGLIIVFKYAEQMKEDERDYQLERATEQIAFGLDDSLYEASLPLFTMGEMARQIDAFDQLPNQTADAPVIYHNSTNPDDNGVFRDVSGICYPTEANQTISYIQTYHELASGIADDVNLTTLTDINLDPSGVLCLLYKLGDDIPHNELKNHPAIGYDSLQSPADNHYTKKAFETNGPVMNGPFALIEDGNESNSLIAIDPVFYGSNKSNFWGFSEVILDWKKMESQLDMHNYFYENVMEFHLTRPATKNDVDVVHFNNEVSNSFDISN